MSSDHHRYSMDLPPPSPGIPPNSAKPFLPPGATNLAPSGYTSSPSPSQRNSYRLSYTAPPNQAQVLTPGGTQRQFPPSAYVDPSAGTPLDSVSTSSHNQTRRMSSDEMGRSTFGAAQRNSSMTSFAPPPAPWMRTESLHGSDFSVSSGRNGTLTPRKRAAAPSTLIRGPVEKPWLAKKDPWERASWWITFILFIVGIGAAAVLCFFGFREVPKLGNTCLVMADNFDNLDTSGTWTRVVELGGLRTGDFAM